MKGIKMTRIGDNGRLRANSYKPADIEEESKSDCSNSKRPTSEKIESINLFESAIKSDNNNKEVAQSNTSVKDNLLMNSQGSRSEISTKLY
jgi:hypothetical protein